MPKNADIFICELCDFKCSKFSNYNKHISTVKHKLKQNKTKGTSNIKCECGKELASRGSLFNHKKNCNFIKYNIGNNSDDMNEYKQLCEQLINENRDLTNKIVELAKEPKTINNTTNNTTNNNTTNNMTINVFLNEKCKDAINLIDFVNNLNITWEDTKEIKDICIEQSLTNLIMDKVKDMDITKRPIHCTDKKRLQYYVKDGDWKNADVDHVFDNVLYDLSKKHVNNIAEYGEEHPEWIQNDDNTEMYFGITTNCMIYKYEMERRRNKVKKLLSDKVLLKKEDIQNA